MNKIAILDYWRQRQNRLRFVSIFLILNCWRLLSPYLKFLVAICVFLILIIYFPVVYKKALNWPRWLKPFFLYIATCLIFFIPALSAITEYKTVQSDMFNFFIINLIFFLMIYEELDQERYRFLINSFFSTHLKLCIIFSVVGLMKLLLLINGHQLSFIHYRFVYPWGSSLSEDYNMYGLLILIGLLYLCYKFITVESFKLQRFLIYSFLLMFNFIYSGSRKAIVGLALVFVFFIIIIALPKILSAKMRKRIIVALMGLFIFLISFVTIHACLLFSGSSKFRKDIFSMVGVDYKGFLGQALPLAIRYKTILLPRTNVNTEVSRLNHKALEDISRVQNTQMLINNDSSHSLIIYSSVSNAYTDRASIIKSSSNIFLNEYSISEQIFGGGFRYLKRLSEIFNYPDIKEHYPHNSVISVLLYGGIIGGFILFFLLLQILFVLAKNLPLSSVQLVTFLVSLLFVLTSGNSIFSNSMCITILMLSVLGFNVYEI